MKMSAWVFFVGIYSFLFFFLELTNFAKMMFIYISLSCVIHVSVL